MPTISGAVCRLIADASQSASEARGIGGGDENSLDRPSLYVSSGASQRAPDNKALAGNVVEILGGLFDGLTIFMYRSSTSFHVREFLSEGLLRFKMKSSGGTGEWHRVAEEPYTPSKIIGSSHPRLVRVFL